MSFDIFKDPWLIAFSIAAAVAVTLGPMFVYIALSRWVF